MSEGVHVRSIWLGSVDEIRFCDTEKENPFGKLKEKLVARSSQQVLNSVGLGDVRC